MIPVRRLLGNAIVLLRLTPAEFWASTPHEIYAGFLALNTKKWNEASDADQNMTQVLAQRYEKAANDGN